MTVAGKRYEYVAQSLWAWLGPAFRGIDADLRALEDSAGGGGTLPYNPTQAGIDAMPAGQLYVTGP